MGECERDDDCSNVGGVRRAICMYLFWSIMNPLYGYFGDDLSPSPPYESRETRAGILRGGTYMKVSSSPSVIVPLDNVGVYANILIEFANDIEAPLDLHQRCRQ